MLRSALLCLLLLTLVPAAAHAAPPANDAPDRPDSFAVNFAPNGTPGEQSAIAELAEATADARVPPCLGNDSFLRTVWFTVPAAAATRELTVEATGRTTDLVDLAAFVQPGSSTNTTEPNACSGEGAGASEAAEDRTSAVSLRVPAGRALLVQVGRRGPVGSGEDEQAILSLAATELPATPRPPGDSAEGAPPAADDPIPLGGATLTEEDPAQPACPSRGSVWRDLGPAAGTLADIAAEGEEVATLTLFQGPKPTGENAVACVNRERGGALRLTGVTVVPGQRLWLRLGTERPPADAMARLAVSAQTSSATPAGVGSPAALTAGPSGSGAPTGLGAPTGSVARRATSCIPRVQGRTRATRTRIALALSGRRQRITRRNRFKTLPVTLQAFRGPACSVRVSVVGPGGKTYARGTAARLSTRRALRLRRVRRLVRGTYRLRVTALNPARRRVRLITSSKPPLRIR